MYVQSRMEYSGRCAERFVDGALAETQYADSGQQPAEGGQRQQRRCGGAPDEAECPTACQIDTEPTARTGAEACEVRPLQTQQARNRAVGVTAPLRRRGAGAVPP